MRWFRRQDPARRGEPVVVPPAPAALTSPALRAVDETLSALLAAPTARWVCDLAGDGIGLSCRTSGSDIGSGFACGAPRPHVPVTSMPYRPCAPASVLLGPTIGSADGGLVVCDEHEGFLRLHRFVDGVRAGAVAARVRGRWEQTPQPLGYAYPEHDGSDHGELNRASCEHGRSALAIGTTTLGGEYRVCAADAWHRRWFQQGWPEAWDDARWQAAHRDGLDPRPGLRWFTGPPHPNLLVDCECGCHCNQTIPFGETDPTGGVLRCTSCWTAEHSTDQPWPVGDQLRAHPVWW